MSSVTEIVSLFRKTRPTRPILLFGAGTSFRAGIPLARECVFKIAQASYARVNGQDWRFSKPRMSDWRPYLQRQPWFVPGDENLSDNFPLAVEHLLIPQEFRREFLTELIKPVHGINPGYGSLANIMLRGLSHTVLTGNFDSLIVDGLREKGPHVRDIVEINRTADDLVRFNSFNRYQVVYLHGAVEFYRDKNLPEETERLDDKLVRLVRPMLKDAPLVVIGYRGYESSIMEHLLLEGIEECENYRQGIYWCLRRGEKIHDHAQKLAQKIKPNFFVIEIEGFDELMAELDTELHEDALYLPNVPFSTSERTTSSGTTFDQDLMKGIGLDALDTDLILSTLTEYCQRLDIPQVDGRNFVNFLVEQGFVTRDEQGIIPTKGCYLLFGKDVPSHFPHASVTVTVGGKKRTVISGNLREQFDALAALLTQPPINPMLRVKRNRDAEEKPAFPERAIVEILVNLLVHRDYKELLHSEIEQTPGENLRFTNPGGLLPKVRSRVRVDANGHFQPTRNVTELRNPLLADIFYGLYHMDKQGSGLADVQELMVEYGGQSAFSVNANNTAVIATLIQPIQKTPDASRTARRITPTETYVTNLLPFKVLPQNIYRMPLKEQFHQGYALISETSDPTQFPVFIRHAGEMISFADPAYFPDYFNAYGFPDLTKEKTWHDFVLDEKGKEDEVKRRIVVWLIGRHMERFLEEHDPGLVLERRQKRAYFKLLDGDRRVITYDARVRKNIKRTVVIARHEGKYFENEGIAHQVVRFADYWAMQIKPFYMFTQPDGVTPLPAFLRSQRATRRMKFDRNPNVDSDLSFWVRYLSKGQAVINLGGLGVNELILGSDYISADVPIWKGQNA